MQAQPIFNAYTPPITAQAQSQAELQTQGRASQAPVTTQAPAIATSTSTTVTATSHITQPAPQFHQYYSPQQYIPPTSTTPQKGKAKEEQKSAANVPPPTYRPPIPAVAASPTVQPVSAVPPTFQMRYSSQGPPVVALSPAATQMHAQVRPQGTVHHHAAPVATAHAAAAGAGVGGEDDDDVDELPFMSDDVYGQGLLWQSQSKDNLKILMDNFTPEQFERYEAYRRSALPKQSVRKVIQQTTNYSVSQPVAQVLAGFSKVFVGEIIEKARAVQAKWGEPPETPLSPEHLREAYRLYQQETGAVGAARVHKGRKLFNR